MTPEERSSRFDITPWTGGWRLIVLFLATIVMAMAASFAWEFWLERMVYAYYGWPFYQTEIDGLYDASEATTVTVIAIIGPAILLFLSVRQRDHVHKQLQIALLTAQAANTAKSQFLANMSHELRTPLNAVIGFADLMRTEPFGPLLPRYQQYATDIRNSGVHLLAVINDVLDISKAEIVGLSVRLSDVDLGEVFAEVETLTAALALNASIALHFEIPDKKAGAIFVSADHTRLKQALINLISNGIKFNSIGGSVTVRAFADISTVRIEILDTGIGMESSEVTRAFQPFVQLHTGHSRKYEGTGLGLPLTKGLIEAMNGSIAIQSDVGAGTCVTIALSRVARADLAHAA